MAERKYNEEDFKKWAEKYKECLSFAEVARCFGVHISIVSRKLNKYKRSFDIKLKSELNKDLILQGSKKCSHCKEIVNISDFGFGRPECKKCKISISKKYRTNNREAILQKKSNYYNKNKELILEKQKECHRNRKNKRKNYERNKRIENINYRLAWNFRTRFNLALKNNYKCGSAVKDLGCSVEEFKKYFEQKFYINSETGDEMTWENYGRMWQIDHIIPLASFDLNDISQVTIACNYLNLQPLWIKDHIIKTSNDISFIRGKDGKK